MANDTAPAGWNAINGRIKDEGALAEGRNKLLKAGLACFSKNGYSKTSVNDVAAAANVSIGSLYKYVRAKEDILWLVSEAGFDRTNEAMARALNVDGSSTSKLDAVVNGLVRQADGDRDLVRLLYVEFQYMPQPMQSRLHQQEERHVSEITTLIEQGIGHGEFHCDDPRMAALAISMTASTWVLKRHLLRRVSLTAYITRNQALARRLVGIESA
ncbi:TetR/AcrR family transcriptional regulator [Mycobacterium sp. NPDC003449]